MARLGPAARVVALAFVVLGAAVVAMGSGGGAVPIVALAVVFVFATQRPLPTMRPPHALQRVPSDDASPIHVGLAGNRARRARRHQAVTRRRS